MDALTTHRAQTTEAQSRWTGHSGRDLREWLEMIRSHGELVTIDAEVDAEEELTAIAFMAAQKNGRQALLFRNLKGDNTRSSILINILAASKKRYALTVGLDPALSIREMIGATRGLLKQRIAPTVVARADATVSARVLTGSDIDLTRYPVPKFWPGDGGRYFGTGSVVLTRNADTGIINVGVYRQQLHSPTTLGLHMVPGRHGLRNCESWWSKGRPADIVVAHGVHPALFIAATQSFKPDQSELDVAGGLIGSAVELTAGHLVDLPRPARAELVIEGQGHKDRLQLEGPLGEWHGFYSGSPALKHVIDVVAVHQRTEPILSAALMANYPACEIGIYHTIMRSARIWDSLEDMGVPGLAGVYAHPGAANGYGLIVVSLKQSYPGHAAQTLALTAQCPAAAYCTKWMIAVDDDVDPTDIDQVMWALTARANPSEDIDVLRNTWSNRNDQSLAPETASYGSKALINACTPHKQIGKGSSRAFLRKRIADRVSQRWTEFGFADSPPTMDQFHEDVEATPPSKAR
ncbi:MAG: UbiD family decarboxylase [Hyphomicrobiales bacterium]|nr:UbiD family decarboxylase [Hyphomicrobiales bacterium]